MPLYDEKVRTRTAAMQAGERNFDFYDSSGRSPFAVYRDLVNSWILEFPQGERLELVSRMKTGTNVQYEQALAEIIIYVALMRSGYQVDVHPASPNATRRPDFLARNQAGEPVAYVEVTSFGPDVKEAASDQREAVIYNGLETVDLPPGWLLGYQLQTRGLSSPSVAKLKAEVEIWAREVCGDDPAEMPQRVFVAQDWQIELTLYGGFDKSKVYDRKIGAAMIGAREVSPADDLRAALKTKARKYCIEDTPFVIVVTDCKDSIVSGEDTEDTILDGMFGNPRVVVRTFPDGTKETIEERAPDGFWGVPGKPANANVSAVVVLPEPSLWKLRDERWQPQIAYNPFARNPISTKFLPISGIEVDLKEGNFKRTEGSLLADLLGLPAEWPPED